MRDLLLITAFVLIMAYLQARSSKKILRYNSNLTTTQTAKKDNGIYMTIALIVMMAIAMLRGVSVGNDTEEYYRIFTRVVSEQDYARITRYETGYIFLNEVVGKFTNNPQGIIIVSALIYYPVYIWFLHKYSKNYTLSLLFFFLFCFGMTLNIIRQELAIAFLLIAYDRVLNKKTLAAYIWIAIAITFHTSAIIFLLMPLLPHIKFDKGFAIFFTLFVVILTVTNALFKIFDLIAPRYSHYFGGKYVGTGILGITYQLLRSVIIFIIIYVVINKIKDNKIAGQSKLNLNYQNNLVAWLAYIPAVVLIFGYRINLIDRFVTYFITFYIIFIPNALKRYDRNTQKVLSFAIVAVMIAYSIATQLFRPEWNTIYPYHFFWQ